MILKGLFKSYYKLSKMGIVVFALLTASLAYLLSLNSFSHFSLETLIVLGVGFYFVCSGSFILNQAQEWKWDQKMNRTKFRPIPQGKMSPYQAYVLAVAFLFFGLSMLFLVQTLTALLAFITVLLYNVFYTLWWKRKMKYGAILGAIPGAMPPVIGYSAGGASVLEPACLYLFLLLFFWQMPHFWSLAIHYKEDYKKAGFPILPVVVGSGKTLYHIGLYTLAYLGLTLISPLFVQTGVMYLILLVPFAVILLYQFHKYFYNPQKWLSFFLWVNLSVLVYFCVPVLDKLIFHSIVQTQYSVAEF